MNDHDRCSLVKRWKMKVHVGQNNKPVILASCQTHNPNLQELVHDFMAFFEGMQDVEIIVLNHDSFMCMNHSAWRGVRTCHWKLVDCHAFDRLDTPQECERYPSRAIRYLIYGDGGSKYPLLSSLTS